MERIHLYAAGYAFKEICIWSDTLGKVALRLLGADARDLNFLHLAQAAKRGKEKKASLRVSDVEQRTNASAPKSLSLLVSLCSLRELRAVLRNVPRQTRITAWSLIISGKTQRSAALLMAFCSVKRIATNIAIGECGKRVA